MSYIPKKRPIWYAAWMHNTVTDTIACKHFKGEKYEWRKSSLYDQTTECRGKSCLGRCAFFSYTNRCVTCSPHPHGVCSRRKIFSSLNCDWLSWSFIFPTIWSSRGGTVSPYLSLPTLSAAHFSTSDTVGKSGMASTRAGAARSLVAGWSKCRQVQAGQV